MAELLQFVQIPLSSIYDDCIRFRVMLYFYYANDRFKLRILKIILLFGHIVNLKILPDDRSPRIVYWVIQAKLVIFMDILFIDEQTDIF